MSAPAAVETKVVPITMVAGLNPQGYAGRITDNDYHSEDNQQALDQFDRACDRIPMDLVGDEARKEVRKLTRRGLLLDIHPKHLFHGAMKAGLESHYHLTEASVRAEMQADINRFMGVAVDVDIFDAPAVIVKRSPLDWAELATRQPAPREWLIDQWLSYDPTLCAGRGGIGKTLIAQQVGSALALGRDMLGSITKPHTVLMWACEDDHDELWRRQAAMAAYFGVPLGDFKGRLIVEPRRGEDNTLLVSSYGKPQFTPLMDELIAQVNDYKADVVIVDNIGQTYGANENERHPVTTFMNAMAGIGRGRKVAPIVLAHPARAKGSEFAGNAAWENAARMRWFLNDALPDVKQDDDAEPDPLVRYLCKRKMNYTVKDFRRLVYSAGVLVADAAPVEGADFARKEMAMAAVLAGIARLNEMGECATSSTASPSYLPKLLVRYKLTEGCARRELDEAMRAAIGTGAIKTAVVGKYQNRTDKMGLVLVS